MWCTKRPSETEQTLYLHREARGRPAWSLTTRGARWGGGTSTSRGQGSLLAGSGGALGRDPATVHGPTGALGLREVGTPRSVKIEGTSAEVAPTACSG